MSKVLMYTTAICPYCVRAKALLKKKGIDYDELRIDGDRAVMREMLERSKRRTVPQIFIDDYHVGGYEDLVELDAFGKLDSLLGLKPHLEPDVTQEEADPT
ncbi:MAG: glutaredoxin 3 [Gammaproteobacteria bacterium]|nr:glutaredoxin 3 [Gammaproteobacteria bacterium]